MKVLEYYYNPVSNNYLSVSEDKYFPKFEPTITDNCSSQTVSYKNRLINNPIYMGSGDAGNGNPDDGLAIGGSGIFTGKSDAEKLRMCGVNGDWSPQSALSRGLITRIDIPCPPKSIEFNKYAANDLVAIFKEINALGWYKLSISSAFRRNLSAGGHSRHQVGLAVDINAGRAGNPWFAGIGKGKGSMPQSEPAEGSTAPWSCKQCPYSGTYDRSRCIWHWNHPVVKIFKSHGWGWGGAYGDVMHFSIDGH